MMREYKNLQFLATAFLSLLFMLATIAFIDITRIFPLINSDSLFFQVLYRDLFVESNPLHGWDLNTTFNLLPNALLYLIAFIISKNPFINTLIHGMLQYALFFAALYWFYRTVRPLVPLKWHVPGLLLINLFFLDAIMEDSYYLFTQFIHPYHFGAFILFIVLAAFSFKDLKNPTTQKAIFIVLIGAIGVFSNRMLIVMFMVPWTGAMLVALLKKRITVPLFIRTAALTIGSAMLGMLLFILVKNLGIITFSSTKIFTWSNVIPSLNALFDTYSNLLTQSIPMTFVVVFSFAYFIFNLIWCIRDFVGSENKTVEPRNGYNLNHWMIVSLGFMILVFFAPAINGMFFGIASVRYNFFVLILPLINAGVLAHRFWGPKKHAEGVSLVVSVVALLVFAVFLTVFGLRAPLKERFTQKIDLYPKGAKLLDELSEQYDLKNGISFYWEAKISTLYSKKGIQLRQVHAGLTMYPMAAARSWYFAQNKDAERPVFNFILFDKSMSMESIKDIFGEENVQIIKRDSSTILIVPEFTYKSNHKIKLLSD